MDDFPKEMKAYVLKGHGGFDQLIYHDKWPLPELKESEVLIRVLACGLNNTDINTRTAWYSKAVHEATTGQAFEDSDDVDSSWGGSSITFPRIQGADVCGIVEGVADSVPKHFLGKRVIVDGWLRDWDDPLNKNKCGYYGSECDGGYAQYTKAHFKNVHVIDSDLRSVELATFSTSYITAENMLNRAEVVKGDRVLIPGASGGVGSALIQLAKRRGAFTIGLSSESKHEDLKKTGVDVLLPRNPVDLKGAIKKMCGFDQVSVVADVVGGIQFGSLIDVLERGGRYTCSGAIAGPIVELDLRTFYLKDLTFTGATIVPPGIFSNLVSYIEKKEISPLLAEVYPLKDLIAAQKSFIAKGFIGNIVIDLEA